MISRAETSDPTGAIRLSDATCGTTGTIVELDGRAPHARKLLAMGILPGVRVRLLQRWPCYVFQVGRSQFTVDRQLADQMHLEPDAPAEAH